MMLKQYVKEETQERDRKEIEDILIQERIYPVFQPIVSLRDGSVIGYEALSRIKGESSIENPEKLFNAAIKYRKIWELEQLCRKKALKAWAESKEKTREKRLFLNVSPCIIHDRKFQTGFTKEYLRRYSINPSQIVFEITERESSKDKEGFSDVVEHYKEQQYEIAIDDLGSCYSGLNLICELQPHFVKLDMQLVRELQKSNSKYALVKSLVEFSRMTRVQLIAEGIETKEELETLINIVILYHNRYEELVNKITKIFEEKAHEYYSEEDRQKGYIEVKNRHGIIEKFPLLSITIAFTTDKDRKYSSQYELSEELARRKKVNKQKEGFGNAAN